MYCYLNFRNPLCSLWIVIHDIVYTVPWRVVILENRSAFLIALHAFFIVPLQYLSRAEISIWKYIALFSKNFFVLICHAFFNMYYIRLLSPPMNNNVNGCSVQYNQQRFLGCVGRRMETSPMLESDFFILTLNAIQIPFLSSMIICLV